jgi:phytoene dehydrogenase-like protein
MVHGMFDTMVIGRDLSSLIAALTLSRRGAKTLLLTEGYHEMAHREAGYLFPVDSTPLSGFGVGQTVFSLLKELDLAPDDETGTILTDPAIQLILPDHRIDLFQDDEQMIADFIREFPDQEEEIRRFYKAVSRAAPRIERWLEKDSTDHPTGFARLWRKALRLPAAMAGSLSLIVHGNGTSGTFKRAVEAQLALLSHISSPGHPLRLSSAYLLSLPKRGIYYPSGGITAWMKRLRQGFTDSGGILMENCSVIRVDTKPEIVIDVDSAGKLETFRSRKMILSVRWEKLQSLVFNHVIFKRLARRLEALPPAAYPFCLHLGVQEGALPERLSPYAIVMRDAKSEATDHDIVFIETSRPGETERAPEGKRAMSATVFLKESPLLTDDITLQGTANSIIDSLEYFLPFLRDNIDYVNIQKSIALARECHESVNLKYSSPLREIIGLSAFTPETPHPDLFLTGAMLRPGLGFEGEIISGMDAAYLAGREIQHHGL